ncbi:hypothetical protein TNIN_128821 [Trichonephila inaurata madagascariensis]|uniref:Uncharacterized protein n=1 Tax=Trichonephila inaurata madagascariensis TaxID=2747483 RepID=A0A8X7CHQ2_9ARAC|nr:hypothetical protein TNIN_128821 [Trichonephila inaurata madagascariensis]
MRSIIGDFRSQDQRVVSYTDILIGGKHSSSNAKGVNLFSLGDSKPFVVRSDLGWIVAGNVPSEECFLQQLRLIASRRRLNLHLMKKVSFGFIRYSSSFYVDDLLSGAATERKQLNSSRQLKEMMRREGFNLQVAV